MVTSHLHTVSMLMPTEVDDTVNVVEELTVLCRIRDFKIG